MSNELKPCPFCGGTELEKEKYCDLIGWLYRVRCKNCPTVMIESLADMEDAIKKWNTRPYEDRLQREIVPLEYENMRLKEESSKLHDIIDKAILALAEHNPFQLAALFAASQALNNEKQKMAKACCVKADNTESEGKDEN